MRPIKALLIGLGGVGLIVVTVWLVVGEDDADTSKGPKRADDRSTSAKSHVDRLLAEVGLSAPDRVSCGEYNNTFDGPKKKIQKGVECMHRASKQGKAAQLRINRGRDCIYKTTYVATADGKMLEVYNKSCPFDRVRYERRVSTCRDVAWRADPGRLKCLEPKELYVTHEK